MSDPPPSLFARLALAFACWFRLLVDPDFAARVLQVRSQELPSPPAPEPPLPPPPSPPSPPAREEASIAAEGALRVLGLLQREGRLIDFLEEDVASFPDADIGAAARVVHEGCRRALRGLVELAPLRTEAEGAAVEVPEGYDAAATKLTGNVKGSGPYRGALRHRGWRARSTKLPVLLPGADPTILTPAEVEL